MNQVARELGMSPETLRNWVRKQERQAGTGPAVSGADGLSMAGKDAGCEDHALGHWLDPTAADQRALNGTRQSRVAARPARGSRDRPNRQLPV
ncbi:transposase [Plantactinospora sp. DSM 117369]